MNIKVPKGMRERAERDGLNGSREFDLGFLAGMDFACHDISENPIVPTEEEVNLEICSAMGFRPHLDGNGKIVGAKPNPDFVSGFKIGADWVQRRMFLEPEVPEAIKDLLWTLEKNDTHPFCEDEEGKQGAGTHARRHHNKQILEAYRLGQQSKLDNSK